MQPLHQVQLCPANLNRMKLTKQEANILDFLFLSFDWFRNNPQAFHCIKMISCFIHNTSYRKIFIRNHASSESSNYRRRRVSKNEALHKWTLLENKSDFVKRNMHKDILDKYILDIYTNHLIFAMKVFQVNYFWKAKHCDFG